MATKIYVAVDKETGQVLSGAHGQHAYGSPGNLRKSMTYSLRYKARQKGVATGDLYTIREIDVATLPDAE